MKFYNVVVTTSTSFSVEADSYDEAEALVNGTWEVDRVMDCIEETSLTSHELTEDEDGPNEDTQWIVYRDENGELDIR